MEPKIFLSVIAVVFGALEIRGETDTDDFYYDVFPQGFKWGYASSSYQVEGAWNSSGKGESIWDEFTHRQNSTILDGSSGDVACDSYNRYHEDVMALKHAGANFYRFSISWPRIIPTGRLSEGVNQAGIDYYNRLINDLWGNGIEPVVTIYHWDLPQPLMVNGGWLSEETALYYAEYAQLVFELFGDRVKSWMTFNEPGAHCRLSYGAGSHAPGIGDPFKDPYKCLHNILKAHGLAYRIYAEKYRSGQDGKIGLAVLSIWPEPRDRNNPEDVSASHQALRFGLGWIFNPLLTGEYPRIMREIIDKKSFAEGLKISRLPTFNERWTRIINGTIDFVGLNHYTSMYIFPKYTGLFSAYFGESETDLSVIEDAAPEALPWLRVVPWGFRRLLNWLAIEYSNMPIFVAENGYAEKNTAGRMDTQRINFHKEYINQMLKAVKIDGVNVMGYAVWSLLDSFEWENGYMARLGVYYIDHAAGKMKRVPKDSVKFLNQVFRDNGFPSQPLA